jgi:homoserine dehydrogenase
MQTLKVAILGYGDAGRAYGKLITEKMPEIIEKYQTKVVVTAIATKTRGTLIDPVGIDLVEVEAQLASGGKFSGGTAKGAVEVAETAEYDVLIELTPLDIFTGQPATDHVKAALNRGKHVITANKGPVAWAFRELRELAAEKNCMFLYETTVMDGAPVFNLVNDTLKMCKVTGIQGILNSTTNFILEELAKGVPYDDILEEGKRRGFVEADPALDVEGWDSAAKVAALMNVLMDAGITPLEVSREGISGITPDMIKDAAKRGKVIKLLCGGEVVDGKGAGYVRRSEVDTSDLFASITGTTSVVSITTDLMGTVSVIEHDPETSQTAYGILSDTLRVIEKAASPLRYNEKARFAPGINPVSS